MRTSGPSPAVTPQTKWTIYVNPRKTSWLLPPLVSLTVTSLGGGPGMGLQGGLGLEAGVRPGPSLAAPAQALWAPAEAGLRGPGQVGARQLAQDPPRGLVPQGVCGHQMGCPAEEGSPALAASLSPQPRRMSLAPWKAAASRSRPALGPLMLLSAKLGKAVGRGTAGLRADRAIPTAATCVCGWQVSPLQDPGPCVDAGGGGAGREGP